MNDKSGWSEYQKLVLSELKRLSREQHLMNEKLNKALVEIMMLKVKSGLWGSLAGVVSFGVAEMIKNVVSK